MTRIAILGGGISGLAAAYELELARKRGADIDWHLYEASERLGGIVETTRHETPEGDYILEGGPDAWVSEKSWARELVLELGLEDQLIPSNDATRKTYIWRASGTPENTASKLQSVPDRMRLMVPEDLRTLDGSPLFSASAKTAYANELMRAVELREAAPKTDESVARFVLRHFGEDVLTTLAAPLLSGVFGGDVAKLSVRAVMPAFVAMEREHGSLILALQAKARERGDKPATPTFTSLRSGMASLTEALVATLPANRLHTNHAALSLKREGKLWCLRSATPAGGKSKKHFRHILLATPLESTRVLLKPFAPQAATLLPSKASSAVLATLVWPAEIARSFSVPPGFGFLVSQAHRAPQTLSSRPKQDSSIVLRSGEIPAFLNVEPGTNSSPTPQLLACTFVDQKFPHRAPSGARILRAFFGGTSAEHFAPASDEAVAEAALSQLQTILGPLPNPDHALTTVRRWPRSLPQYEVGHLDRMDQLDALVRDISGIHLLGNSYRGVGLPDLIKSARESVRQIAL